MMNGADKYGPYNWRAKNVVANIYVDAALRHLFAWFEGEETASDSGVHHLGHAMACCAILLDAQSNGNLIDDRPDKGAYTEVLETLNQTIKACRAASIPDATGDSTPVKPESKWISKECADTVLQNGFTNENRSR